MVTYAISLGIILRDPTEFRRQQRRWALGLTKFWGVDVRVFGAEHMDESKSYVVMSNHLSYSDIVALFIALPIIPGFLAKAELVRIPFLGAALRAGGHVVIERDKSARARAAIDSAADQVRGGRTVLIFPEGTRGGSNTIGEFKRGGFHLAKSAGVPIVPVGLRGTRAVGPRNSMLFWPGTIEVHIGEAVSPERVEQLAFADLVSDVRKRVMDLAAMPAREAVQGVREPS